MHHEAGEGVAGITGRESELRILGEFTAAAADGGALILKGAPGAGKTALWEAGRDAALARGTRVLSARPDSAETSMSYAGLADLLDGIGPEVLGGLPPPQRRGLEVALLRADPAGEAATPRAVAFGVLNLLRQLAVGQPLLVAVDDLQWLDRPTADVLAFAAAGFRGRTRGSSSPRAQEPRRLWNGHSPRLGTRPWRWGLSALVPCAACCWTGWI